jgi:RNA polymerase sigma factor (sigma-70 family)
VFRHLLRYAVTTLLGIGARILPKLKADPKLAEAWSLLQAAQDTLEARVKAHDDSVTASRNAVEARNQAYRNLSDKVREFALAMLSVVRNNHGADDYLIYFPDGYGDAIHEKPEILSDFAAVLINKLAAEVDTWILSFRDRLASARDAFVTAQNVAVEAVRAEREAWSFLDSERRQWIRLLYESRWKARREVVHPQGVHPRPALPCSGEPCRRERDDSSSDPQHPGRARGADIRSPRGHRDSADSAGSSRGAGRWSGGLMVRRDGAFVGPHTHRPTSRRSGRALLSDGSGNVVVNGGSITGSDPAGGVATPRRRGLRPLLSGATSIPTPDVPHGATPGLQDSEPDKPLPVDLPANYDPGEKALREQDTGRCGEDRSAELPRPNKGSWGLPQETALASERLAMAASRLTPTDSSGQTEPQHTTTDPHVKAPSPGRESPGPDPDGTACHETKIDPKVTFAEVFARDYTRFKALAYRVVKDSELAEDIVQECCVRALHVLSVPEKDIPLGDPGMPVGDPAKLLEDAETPVDYPKTPDGDIPVGHPQMPDGDHEVPKGGSEMSVDDRGMPRMIRRDEQGMTAWMFQTVRWLSSNARRFRETWSECEWSECESDIDPADITVEPEDLVVRKDDIARVQSLLARLPREDADILIMKYDDHTYKEMAAALGIKTGNVHYRLVRAQARLASLMHEEDLKCPGRSDEPSAGKNRGKRDATPDKRRKGTPSKNCTRHQGTAAAADRGGVAPAPGRSRAKKSRRVLRES